jgi:hypothetical protein
MADRHVLKVSPKTVQWGVWNASLEPVAGGAAVVLAPVKFLGRPGPHPGKGKR